MEDNAQDMLARAYVLLSSLRKNVTQAGSVSEKYVNEYRLVLDKLQKIGINISDFQIPLSEIKPRLLSFNYATHEERYSTEKYVDQAYFLTKLDALLGYFEIITSEQPRRIGFRPPDS